MLLLIARALSTKPETEHRPTAIDTTQASASTSSLATPASDGQSKQSSSRNVPINERTLALNKQMDEQAESSGPSIDADPTAAYVSAKLEHMTLTRQQATATSKEKKANVLKIHLLKATMDKAKAAYLFNRHDAEAAFNDAKSKLEGDTKLNHANGTSVSSPESEAVGDQAGEAYGEPEHDGDDSLETTAEPGISLNGQETATSAPVEAEEEEPGSMFGSMLEEMPETETIETGAVVRVRDMAIPKHISAKPPRGLLEEAVKRRDRFARTNFSVISTSRAVRAALLIRWEDATEQRFVMDEEACYDKVQAFNYVATLALFALDANSVSRQLAPAFRVLWLELEAKRKLEEEAAYREHIKLLQDVVRPRTEDATSVRLPFFQLSDLSNSIRVEPSQSNST